MPDTPAAKDLDERPPPETRQAALDDAVILAERCSWICVAMLLLSLCLNTATVVRPFPERYAPTLLQVPGFKELIFVKVFAMAGGLCVGLTLALLVRRQLCALGYTVTKLSSLLHRCTPRQQQQQVLPSTPSTRSPSTPHDPPSREAPAPRNLRVDDSSMQRLLRLLMAVFGVLAAVGGVNGGIISLFGRPRDVKKLYRDPYIMAFIDWDVALIGLSEVLTACLLFVLYSASRRHSSIPKPPPAPTPHNTPCPPSPAEDATGNCSANFDQQPDAHAHSFVHVISVIDQAKQLQGPSIGQHKTPGGIYDVYQQFSWDNLRHHVGPPGFVGFSAFLWAGTLTTLLVRRYDDKFHDGQMQKYVTWPHIIILVLLLANMSLFLFVTLFARPAALRRVKWCLWWPNQLMSAYRFYDLIRTSVSDTPDAQMWGRNSLVVVWWAMFVNTLVFCILIGDRAYERFRTEENNKQAGEQQRTTPRWQRLLLRAMRCVLGRYMPARPMRRWMAYVVRCFLTAVDLVADATTALLVLQLTKWSSPVGWGIMVLCGLDAACWFVKLAYPDNGPAVRIMYAVLGLCGEAPILMASIILFSSIRTTGETPSTLYWVLPESAHVAPAEARELFSPLYLVMQLVSTAMSMVVHIAVLIHSSLAGKWELLRGDTHGTSVSAA